MEWWVLWRRGCASGLGVLLGGGVVCMKRVKETVWAKGCVLIKFNNLIEEEEITIR